MKGGYDMSGKGPGPSLPAWWGKVRDVIAASVPILFAAVIGWAYQVNHNLDVMNGLINQQNERVEGEIHVEGSHLHSLDQRFDRDESELKDLRQTSGVDSIQPRLNSIERELADIKTNGTDAMRIVQERQSRMQQTVDTLVAQGTGLESRLSDFGRRIDFIEYRTGVRGPTAPR